MVVMKKNICTTDCMSKEWYLFQKSDTESIYIRTERTIRLEEKVVTGWSRKDIVKKIEQSFGGRKPFWQEEQTWVVSEDNVPFTVIMRGCNTQNSVTVDILTANNQQLYKGVLPLNIGDSKQLKSGIASIIGGYVKNWRKKNEANIRQVNNNLC